MVFKHNKVMLIENELIEISLPSGMFGYCMVIRKDNFGVLIKIYKEKFYKKQPFDLMINKTFNDYEIAYVNDYSIESNWTHVGIIPLNYINKIEIPIIFYGREISGWTLEDGESKKHMSGNKISYNELLNLGYIHKVLWLAKDIENLLDKDIKLIWSGRE